MTNAFGTALRLSKPASVKLFKGILIALISCPVAAFCQSFQPKIIVGPFFRPVEVANEYGEWTAAHLVYSDAETETYIPEKSLIGLGSRLFVNGNFVTMAYIYSKKTEETIGFFMVVNETEKTIVINQGGIGGSNTKYTFANANRRLRLTVDNIREYFNQVEIAENKWMIDAKQRIRTSILKVCPSLTDQQIATIMKSGNLPSNSKDCPLR